MRDIGTTTTSEASDGRATVRLRARSRVLRVCGWLCAAAAFCGALPALAQVATDDPPLSLEMYGLDEGLSQLNVAAMSGDDRGFLWVATQDGLNRFDGHRFNAYRNNPVPVAGRQELASSSIDSLAFEPSRSRLWLGTNDAGLDVVHLPTWQRRTLGVADGLSDVRVAQVLLDPAGGAWLGTALGIDHVDAEISTVRPLGATGAIVGLAWQGVEGRPLALDAQCRLWSVGTTGLTRLPGPRDATRCVSLQVADDGLWIASADGGLHALDHTGQELRHWSVAMLGSGHSEPSAMIRLDDGRVLVGFVDGRVVQLPRGADTPRALRFDRRLRSAITSFHQDDGGAWWIGTYTTGLYRVRPLSSVIRYDAMALGDMDAWSSHSVRAIWRDGDRALIGTDSGMHFRSAVGAPWRAVPELAGQSIRVIRPVVSGGWWIGASSGLWRLHADGRIEKSTALADSRIVDLLVEGDTMWVATQLGLHRLEAGRVVDDPRLAPLASEVVTALSRDRGVGGSLWVGTNTKGVWRLDGNTFARVVPGGAGLHKSAWALHGDADAMWVGTFSAGLYRIDRATGTSTVQTDRDGLTNNVVYRILADAQDRLWLSTNYGLSVVDPASGIFQNLGRRDGLRNQEYNSGAGFIDARGGLYFGGTEGLDVIDPLQLPRLSAPAVPVLTSLQLLSRESDDDARQPTGTDIVYTPSITLDSEDSVFTIGMTAIDFLAPAAAQLRYRVDGLHAGWIYPHEARTEVSINHLPAGTYRLEVQAAGRDGQFGASRLLTIHMPPPLWRHPLAYAVYALLALLLVALFVHRTRRTVRLERHNVDLLNRTVAERTAQLEQANQQLLVSNLQLDAATRLDPLTQVANRRELQDWLTRESARLLTRVEAGVAADNLYFFMLDIDSFKRINDGHGHLAGDEVLVQFAARLRSLRREGDLLVRWGGEEFLLVARLPDADAAAGLAERLRRVAADAAMPLAHGAVLQLTCSIGFAPWPFSSTWPTLGDWQQTSALADRCLYAAKAAGRNAWVGLAPGSAPDRQRLQALLAGSDPATLGDSVRVLHSTAETPRFER